MKALNLSQVLFRVVVTDCSLFVYFEKVKSSHFTMELFCTCSKSRENMKGHCLALELGATGDQYLSETLSSRASPDKTGLATEEVAVALQIIVLRNKIVLSSMLDLIYRCFVRKTLSGLWCDPRF